ncbi:MAG: hypothetical protein KOO69_08015 [Victivallales bacterium]|nr:hypothetical protein [Victivallales bacterium]
MLKKELQKIIETIVSHEKRYSSDAYKFVNAAVNYTVAKQNAKTHVAALELLEGISEFALKEFSIFYEEIFKSWGVNTAADIGNIVFSLIEQKALGASPEDSIEDFNIDFDLFARARSAKSAQHEHNIKVPTID